MLDTVPSCRYSIQARHADGTVYSYHVGICVDPSPDKSNCGVVQVESSSNSSVPSVHCVGMTTHSQVARSE